jgi:hypothetical protein
MNTIIEPWHVIEVPAGQPQGIRRQDGHVYVYKFVDEDDYAAWCAERGWRVACDESRVRYLEWLGFLEWWRNDER